MIEVDSLARAFAREAGAPPVRALDGITLRALPGCVTGLIGPNGAGKTTLFRILAGLMPPDEGRARVCGLDVIAHPTRVRACLGLLTEEVGLPDRLTPLWHVALHGSLHGLARGEAMRRAAELLEEMGLSSSTLQPHAHLSKGSRLKVALARAFVHRPAALLLDEPTSGLDVETARWVRRMLAGRAREGCCVLLATHQPEEAEELCDEIVILGQGRVLRSGSPAEVRRSTTGRPRLRIRIGGSVREALEAIVSLPGAEASEALGDRIVIPCAASVAPALLTAVAGRLGDGRILGFSHEPSSLSDAYVAIQKGAS